MYLANVNQECEMLTALSRSLVNSPLCFVLACASFLFLYYKMVLSSSTSYHCSSYPLFDLQKLLVMIHYLLGRIALVH